MSDKQSLLPVFAFLGAAMALAAPHNVHAVNLSTEVTPIYQVGTGAGVSLGHAVTASTSYNRLVASGSYVASCAHASMLPTTGQRSLTGSNTVGGVRLTTTVPLWVPTIVNMPGFYSLPRGTTVSCTYNWTSKAVESGFSIGVGGVSYQSGNGERSDGSTQLFVMRVPGTSDGGDLVGCIP